MEFFPKIDTLYERSKETFNVKVGLYRRPEFADVSKWLVNEKLDGSNISISATREDGVVNVEWRGRTEKAQFQKEAVAHLEQVCAEWQIALEKILADNNLSQIEFFGELLGPKIQKGSMYTDVVTTVFYDIRVGGKMWLPWTAVREYAELIGYDTPWYAWMTEPEILFSVRNGFDVIYDNNGKGGPAEGLILKTNTPLYSNAGKRLIAKLKTVDFTHGK